MISRHLLKQILLLEERYSIICSPDKRVLLRSKFKNIWQHFVEKILLTTVALRKNILHVFQPHF